MRAPAPPSLPGAASRPGRRLTLGLVALLSLAGCASMEPAGAGPAGGSAGRLTWDVSDVGRVVSADSQRIRWSYLITLRNPSDRVIQLERVERAVVSDYADFVGAAPAPVPFRRSIAARSDLRVSTSDSWGWISPSGTTFGGASSLRGVTAIRRFSGTDDRGAAVQITVSIQLDRSTGRLARPATPPPRLPAPKRLESDGELAGMTGLWRGSYRLDGTLLDVPIELTVLADGSCQVAENEPVTNRFRRTVRVKDGGLEYAGDRERGVLTLHEAEGRRMLVGRVNQIDGPSYALYLEAPGGTTAAPGPVLASARTVR